MKKAVSNAPKLMTFCFMFVLLFSVFTQAALSQASSGPVIDSVSPISTERLQTIIISGSGFGDTQPQTSSLGDGSVNTVDGGDTPSLQIRNNAIEGSWTAGFEDSSDRNAIGVILVSWSDTTIVLGGFGTALSESEQGSWNLECGDQIRVMVKVSGKIASFSTVVEGSLLDNSSGVAPVISSVSPISTDQLQTIVITGTGFGDVQPQLMYLDDGSVNTVGGGDTPILRIYNDGWNGWMAGVRDSPKTAWCLIGVFLVSWSDTEIVLDGFGTALSSYSFEAGDPMRVVVVTSGGRAEYALTAIEGTDTSTDNSQSSELPMPELAVFCQSSTTTSNFRVDITGSLTYNGESLVGVPVVLSYSVNGGSSWNELTLVNTDDNGDFLAVWMLFVTGNYLVKAEFLGNSNYTKTSTEISFSVTSSDEENIISVSSNSSISSFAFDSSSGQLAFSVSGPSGTTGSVSVYVPKSLITDVFDLQVLLDGNMLPYTAETVGDSWHVTFTYNHSTHEVTVKLNDNIFSMQTVNQSGDWVTYSVIAVLSVTVTVLLSLRKQKTLTRKVHD